MDKRLAPWVVGFTIFTVWITWQAKGLELRLGSQNSTAVLNGKPAPAFTLPALDGHAVSLADYRGKTVVVSFWASWCGPCRLEAPLLRSFYERTHRSSVYELLAISLDDTREAAEAAATRLKMPFPVLLDATGKVAKEYHVEGIPTLVVIDPAGKVSYSSVGFDTTTDFMLARQLGIKDYTPGAK